MFENEPSPQQNSAMTLPAATGGLNPSTSLMSLKPNEAVVLENFIARPEGLETREGYETHVSGFSAEVRRLHVYNSAAGSESLWATTDSGVYNATTAGTMGAAAIALTDGRTISTAIATGAGNYLLMVNGVDTLKQYDGAAWTSVAVLGAQPTDVYNYIETYRQRIFLARESSLIIEYLAPNSIAGAPTAYPLGALFRQGGFILAMGTWTIDGGTGPEDNLAVLTNRGEVAVFAGSDPATWALRGVYYIGTPIGQTCMFKYGGDILIITVTGIFPLSQALQAASIDRVQAVSNRIQPTINEAATSFASVEGWQIISQPNGPYLLLNVPSAPQVKQFVMHSQTQRWSIWSGLQATCFALMGKILYFGTEVSVCAVGGVSDDGVNITATCLQAYNRFGYPRNKLTDLIKPYFTSTGDFTYKLGVAPNFLTPQEVTSISSSGTLTASLWGSGLWGVALWTGATNEVQDWQTVPDSYSLWKGFYLQIVSNTATVTYIGADIRFTLGGDF